MTSGPGLGQQSAPCLGSPLSSEQLSLGPWAHSPCALDSRIQVTGQSDNVLWPVGWKWSIYLSSNVQPEQTYSLFM